MEDENALEFLNDEELLKSVDNLFNDNEKELDEIIKKADKQLYFLEKKYRLRRELEKSHPSFYV